MSTTSIHSTAIIEDEAELGNDVSVGPYALIENGSVLGCGSTVHSHAVVKKHTVLGRNVEVGHFAVIGGDPQHLSFDRSTLSSVCVGESTRIGEGVTIHRSIEKDGVTKVGNNCFLMGYSHVAHDCVIEDQVILANGVLLGGHVEVGRDSFLGGGAAVHQFVRIGDGCMIGGLAEISLDIPPQVLVAGRNQISGLNLIGLRRRKVSSVEIAELKQCLHLVLSQGNPAKNASELLGKHAEIKSNVATSFLKFFLDGNRGFARKFKKETHA
jgi:UDP-N-acetylglucosamine acyltransferase